MTRRIRPMTARRAVPAFLSALLVISLAGCASDERDPVIDGSDATGVASGADSSLPSVTETAPVTAEGFYALHATDLDGDDVPLSAYAGKVALVVNVASECGYTPQYKGLEAMYEALEPHGFVILGFPSNEFGGQEPGDAGQIRAFCSNEYGVTFPLFEKCEVLPGTGQSNVFEYLQAQTGEAPGWNFCKYLVGRDGKVLEFFPSRVAPESAELVKAVEAALL